MTRRIPQPTIAPRERAFLVGVELFRQKSLMPLADSLTELALLSDTSGLDVAGELTQKLDRPHVKTYIGPGKVDELKALVEETLSQVVIFDDELSPRHQRELQETLGRNVRVLDRTALILDIFAQHAHSSEGVLQVERAQYDY
jgi:GTP-binding protein HflX